MEPVNVATINQFLKAATRHINLPPVGLSRAPLYPWIVWNLWIARNELIFENRRCSAITVMQKSVKEAKAWEEAQLCCGKTKQFIGTTNWKAGAQSGFKCYVDASWEKNSLDCGFGWCFMNANMELLSEETSNRRNVASALIGEALAIKPAIIAAKNKGFEELHCYSDSLSIITLLNGNGVTNELKSILHDICYLKNDFTSISFNFIPRSENVIADALAKFGRVSLNSSS